ARRAHASAKEASRGRDNRAAPRAGGPRHSLYHHPRRPRTAPDRRRRPRLRRPGRIRDHRHARADHGPRWPSGGGRTQRRRPSAWHRRGGDRASSRTLPRHASRTRARWTMTITVVLAEDQLMVLGALTTLLGLEADITVAGTASDGEEAVRLVETLRPDVLLTDIEMPTMTGLEVAAEIQRLSLPTRAVILT